MQTLIISHQKGIEDTPPRQLSCRVNRFKLNALLLTIMLLFAFSAAFGQVEWKDRHLTLAINDQNNPSVARPSNPDYTIAVWEDERETEGQKQIYIQKIDNE
jgi:hypothetical protein